MTEIHITTADDGTMTVTLSPDVVESLKTALPLIGASAAGVRPPIEESDTDVPPSQ